MGKVYTTAYDALAILCSTMIIIAVSITTPHQVFDLIRVKGLLPQLTDFTNTNCMIGDGALPLLITMLKQSVMSGSLESLVLSYFLSEPIGGGFRAEHDAVMRAQYKAEKERQISALIQALVHCPKLKRIDFQASPSDISMYTRDNDEEEEHTPWPSSHYFELMELIIAGRLPHYERPPLLDLPVTFQPTDRQAIVDSLLRAWEAGRCTSAKRFSFPLSLDHSSMSRLCSNTGLGCVEQVEKVSICVEGAQALLPLIKALRSPTSSISSSLSYLDSLRTGPFVGDGNIGSLRNKPLSEVIVRIDQVFSDIRAIDSSDRNSMIIVVYLIEALLNHPHIRNFELVWKVQEEEDVRVASESSEVIISSALHSCPPPPPGWIIEIIRATVPSGRGDYDSGFILMMRHVERSEPCWFSMQDKETLLEELDIPYMSR